MPLTTPTGLAASRLWRGMMEPMGSDRFRSYDLYADLAWANADSAEHQVEVEIDGRLRATLLQGSTGVGGMLIKRVAAGSAPAASFSVRVRLVGPSGNSPWTTALEVELTNDAKAEYALDAMPIFDDGDRTITLPTWTGVRTSGGVGQAGTISLKNTATQRSYTLPAPTVQQGLTRAIPAYVPDGTYEVLWEPQEWGVYRFSGYYDASSWVRYKIGQGLWPNILTIDLGVASGDFVAADQVVSWKTGESVNLELTASHPATWTLTSGAPVGFGIVEEGGRWFLRGTPTAPGSWSIVATATRISDSATDTAAISAITTNAGGGRTRVVINPGWLNDGLAYKAGDEVKVSVASVPATATWRAVGLPTGLSMSETGLISGRVPNEGRWMATLFATAEGLAESEGAIVTFTVRKKDGSAPGDQPAAVTPRGRLPWITSRWDLIDLQVLARSRQIESTLATGDEGLRIKVGDQVNFAVFFAGEDQLMFDLAPQALRIKVRPADNLEESLILAEATSPDAEGGVVAPGFDELVIEGEAEAATKVTIVGLTSEATRSGGGDEETDLVFSGATAQRPWTFGFRGGEGEEDFELGETLTIALANGFTELPVKGRFRVVALDSSENGADPWVVLSRVDPDPYYLLATSSGQKQRETLESWVEDEAENKPLPCILEAEWVKGGKTYSSQFLRVAFDLDVVRPG